MQLIQCHIENFGKLKSRTISFSDGCQCFLYENGWGKSTLAAFFKVMFYGFDNERSRDDYVNERKRYRPWQGGIYGGSVTFEVKGKRYILERTFGLKEKEDVFLLRDAHTNLVSKDYSVNIGEEIFHLDRHSFEKTVFVSQNDCSTRATDQIQAKLGNLAEATDDVNQYEKADRRLNDLLNAMSPLRKTGSLYRMKEQISDLEAELRRSETLEEEMNSLYKEKRQLEDDDKKYKEIQDALLEQQRRIMVSAETGISEEEYGQEMTKEKQEKWFLPSGLIGFVLGICLLFHQPLWSFLFFVLGAAAFLTVFLKRRTHSKNLQLQFQQYQTALSEQKERQLEEAQQRLKKIQIMMENTYRKKVHLEREIEELVRKRERFFEKEEQFLALKEQYDTDSVQYERLKLTRDYLALAKASYSAKYRSPLMHSFSKYYEMISSEQPDSYRMDSNMDLTIEAYGHQRESRYYSAGWKDMIGICMRMALIDSMYPKERPFLIFDDPFVNLDQKKTKAALKFLKELGEEYQILYFTCHESRRI